MLAASGGLAIAGLFVAQRVSLIGQLMVVAGIEGVIGFAASPWLRRLAAPLATPPGLFGFVIGIAVVWIGTPSHAQLWSDASQSPAHIYHVSGSQFLYEYQVVDGAVCRGIGLRRRERVGDMLTIYYPNAQPCWSRTTPHDPDAFTVQQGVSVAASTPLFGLLFAMLFTRIARRWHRLRH